MKYVALPDFDDVTCALNFDTADCHVIGGCELYTIKASGADKRLYRRIDDALEAQYASLVTLSASLSGTIASTYASSLNLSRSSPFGPFSQRSNRRTYAYLIAILNASHPDYDFSHVLRPADFKRERGLKTVMNTLDSLLYNLKPVPSSPYLNDSMPGLSPAYSACPPSSSHAWGPRMWKLIDGEMTLKDCHIYCYSPEEDPYEGEDGAIWSYNYFFYNRARKRVCYIHLRAISILSHSPSDITPIKTKKRRATDGWSSPIDMDGTKRMKFWFGDRADVQARNSSSEEDVAEVDNQVRQLDDPTYILSDAEEALRSRSSRSKSTDKSTVRGISEDIAETMEV